MSNLEKDLAEVMNNLDDPDNWKVQRDFIRTHHAEIAQNVKDAIRAKRLQSLAAAMYQAAGAYNMPVRFLDILFAAGNGDDITGEQVGLLLPCYEPEDTRRLRALEKAVDSHCGNNTKHQVLERADEIMRDGTPEKAE